MKLKKTLSLSSGLVALSFGALVATAGACSSSKDADTSDAASADATPDLGSQNDGGALDAGDDAAPSPDGAAPDAGDAGTQVVVGAAGGTVTATSGVVIEIPAGALPGDVNITIEEVPGAAPPPGATPVGPTFQFGPDGQTFAKPVKVTLPWSGGDLPVVIAHLPHGSSSWTTLTAGAEHDATHVWATTTSFSPFQAVFYQGSPDSPVVLAKDFPVAEKAIEVGTTKDVYLKGTGFRTDTVVTLFKDGVTTATVSPVTLTEYGLRFSVPAAFTDTIGLITIQAKNPQAAVGDAAALYVIEKPVLESLSPSSVNIDERPDNDYSGVNVPITVTASNLPDLSWCRVIVSQSFGQVAALVATTTDPVETASGFSVTATEWHAITGTSDLGLYCSGVRSNDLPITFNLIKKP